MNEPISPSLLLEVLDASFDEIYITDGSGVTLWVNRACERFYGIDRKEIIGKNVTELEKEGIFNPSLTTRVLATRKKVTGIQSTRSGRKLLVTSLPIFNGCGEVTHVISNSRDITELLTLAERLSDVEELLAHYATELRLLKNRTHVAADPPIAVSPAMQRVLAQVVQVAKVDTTVLITGETGVGKTLVARRIHQLSARNRGPFIEINCGAIPENLIESELFGYERGAFTGARREGKVGMVGMAEGGTLFLDEVAELPLQVQAKLLQLIQDRVYYRVGGTRPVRADIRIIAATNKDLREAVSQGKFRADLYYRLNVVPLRIPPLRERPEDIGRLLDHYLNLFNNRYGRQLVLSPEARSRLLNYTWPGNVRELENMMERLVIVSPGPVILPEDLPEELGLGTVGQASRVQDIPELRAVGLEQISAGVVSARGLNLPKYIDDVERAILRQALQEYGSTHKIARALGISQSSVVRKLRKYGLSS